MNARASLVDQWRQIEFVADQLESQFDLILEGNVGNDGNSNPFRLDLKTGQIRGGFRFDTPIVRLNERNQYRSVLIDYQQTRRQFYQFEDEIKRNLRETVRNLNQNKVLFELNRRTVQVQIEQIELNRFELEAPVAPGAGTSRLGSSAARNLTDAIVGLNGAQNQFLRVWTQYEILRRNLDYDMGTMQVDAMGAWIDPGVIDDSIGIRAAATMGIELDCQFCDLTQYETVNVSDRESDDAAESILDSVIEPADTLEQPVPRRSGAPDLNAPADLNGAGQPSGGLPSERDYFRAAPQTPAGIDGTIKPPQAARCSSIEWSQFVGAIAVRSTRSNPAKFAETRVATGFGGNGRLGRSQAVRIPVDTTRIADLISQPELADGKDPNSEKSSQAAPASVSWDAEMQSFGGVFDRFRAPSNTAKNSN